MKSSNPQQVYCLQLLRAIAATSVVYLHTFTEPVYGSFGLDLFFVISGFVMCMIVEQTDPMPLEFLTNRLTRIVPLYWILSTLVFVVALAAPHLMGTTVASGENYLRSLLFIPHFRQDGQLFPVLMPGWTLNFEMLFYLLIGVAMWVHRQGYVGFVSLVLLLVYGFGPLYPSESVGQVFFHDSLWLEFILGMACFRIHRHPWIRAVPRPVHALVVVGAAWFILTWESQFDRLLVAGLPCFILLLSALQLEDMLRTMHSRILGFLIHIGDASYATYLSHMFVIGAVERILFKLIGIEQKNLATAVFTITCCLVAGSLIYRFVDLPTVQSSRRWTKRLRLAMS